MFTRRGLFGVAFALAFVGFGVSASVAQEKVDMDALLKAKTTTDLVLGSEKAKVTIVEYASYTCSHCADFHKNGFAHLKANYIDKGLVRFIFRELPFDERAMRASMVLRCAAPDNYFAFSDVVFKQQQSWAFVPEWEQALQGLLRQGGIGAEKYASCKDDKSLFTAIMGTAKEAQTKFGVNSTPTLFINGQKHPGALKPDDLDKIIKPLL